MVEVSADHHDFNAAASIAPRHARQDVAHSPGELLHIESIGCGGETSLAKLLNQIRARGLPPGAATLAALQGVARERGDVRLEVCDANRLGGRGNVAVFQR